MCSANLANLTIALAWATLHSAQGAQSTLALESVADATNGLVDPIGIAQRPGDTACS
jgi:hypothetical protein